MLVIGGSAADERDSDERERVSAAGCAGFEYSDRMDFFKSGLAHVLSGRLSVRLGAAESCRFRRLLWVLALWFAGSGSETGVSSLVLPAGVADGDGAGVSFVEGICSPIHFLFSYLSLMKSCRRLASVMGFRIAAGSRAS